jgi:hypothetical protein
MIGELVPLSGDSIQLLKPELTVGGEQHCDIVIRGNAVPSQLFSLSHFDRAWHIRAAGEVPVRVNGINRQAAKLTLGDVVEIAGRHYELK